VVKEHYACTPEEKLAWAFAMRTIERPEHVIKFGWVKKKGEKRHNWNKRYAYLNTLFLRYYTKELGGELKGSIRVVEISSVQKSLHFTKQMAYGEDMFEVTTKDRTWYFICDSEEESGAWMRAIQTAVENAQREKKKAL